MTSSLSIRPRTFFIVMVAAGVAALIVLGLLLPADNMHHRQRPIRISSPGNPIPTEVTRTGSNR